ncbi:MAG: hypothetical protein EOP11_06475 [Proteobacteria bacterium]|nr:MAG: hypothetical protein EOP11_06475 [Pseudomonadota bacterium]
MTWLFLFLALPSLSISAPAADEITELQWAICESDPAATLAKLGEEDWREETSSITYFETKVPSYFADGLSFRVKEKNGAAVAIVKVRGDAAKPGSERCEWDRYGAQETYACKYEARPSSETSPWTEAQKKFIEQFKPVRWAALVPFGPYAVTKLQGKIKKEKVSLEALRVPGRSSILELSARVSSAEAEEIYRKISDRLDRADVRLCRQQEGKTERLFRALGLKSFE